MNIEAFLLCDAATDSQGKLNILGSFDTLYSKSIPVNHPYCCIALRIRFTRFEEGEHKVRIDFVDEDNKKAIPGIDGNLNVRISENLFSSVVNIVFNLQRLKFEKFGEYNINLGIDGKQIGQLPLYLRQIQPQEKNF